MPAWRLEIRLFPLPGMNSILKATLRLVLLMLPLGMLTGCFTERLAGKVNKQTTDTFFPLTVYEPTNHAGFALEGILRSYPLYTIVHACVVFPQQRWNPQDFQRNDDWAGEPNPKVIKDARITKELPPDYEKVAELRKDRYYLTVKEHRPNAGLALLFPLTVAIDIATFPIQGPFILLYGMHPHT